MTFRAGNAFSTSFNGDKGPYINRGPTTYVPAAIWMSGVGGPSPGIAYKNQGWYTTGNVYETWISRGSPSTAPPSGHTLTNLQHTPLNGSFG